MGTLAAIDRMRNSDAARTAAAFNSNVETLRLIIMNNFPENIQRELWGLACKILPLGNYDNVVATMVRVEMDKLETIELGQLDRKTMKTYDWTKWPQLRIVMEVILSMGTGGWLVEKTTNQQEPEHEEHKERDFGKILWGDSGRNENMNPENLRSKW